MATSVSQHSDVTLEFDNIAYSDGTAVDLDSVSEMVLAISKSTSVDSPKTLLTKSEIPTRFIVDNVNKKVSVNVLASDLNFSVGNCYVNLWIIVDNRHLTHTSKIFTITGSVNYS